MRFPIGIQPRTFELVEITLQKLDYEGPVALSCDDTKLLPSLHPYFDKERDGYFIMGNAGEPYRLMDPNAFERVVTSGQLQKASKVGSVVYNANVPHRSSTTSFDYSVFKYLLYGYLPSLFQHLQYPIRSMQKTYLYIFGRS